MTQDKLGISEIVLTSGFVMFVVAILVSIATNCSWWRHSFCNDAAVTGLIGTAIFTTGILGFIMFFAGGLAREINREGKLPPPGVDNEIRRQHEMWSITRKPLLANALILIGLILIWGVSSTLFGGLMNWTSAGIGGVLAIIGFYLKRKVIYPSKPKPESPP